MKNYIKILSILSIFSNSLYAQTISHNNDIWLHYFGKFNLKGRSAVSFEATSRYANGFSEKQQYFVRPSFDYKFSKNLTASLGYSHYKTYVYGEPAINKIPVPENHVWLQATISSQISKLKITNRLRDENRWVGIAGKENNSNDLSIIDYTYRNRIRHMILANYPIAKISNKYQLSAIAGDEAFYNVGKNAGATLMNQNRIIGGMGLTTNPHLQFQLAYIHQHIWNFSNTIRESNPTIRLSVYTNVDLFDSKKQ